MSKEGKCGSYGRAPVLLLLFLLSFGTSFEYLMDGPDILADEGRRVIWNDPRISVNSNLELSSVASSNGWQGTGVEGDPYIIENLTIDAGDRGYCIFIGNTTSHLEIKNCTLLNASSISLPYGPGAGILIWNCHNVDILDTVVEGCSHGLYSGISSDVNIANSTFKGNFANGIYLGECDSLLMENCTVIDNDFGIYLEYCSDINIEDCNVSLNDDHGVLLEQSGECSILDNTMMGNDDGIHFALDPAGRPTTVRGNTIVDSVEYGVYLDSDGEVFYDNDMISCGFYIHCDPEETEEKSKKKLSSHIIPPNNTVNGYPVYYVVDVNGTGCPLPEDHGQLLLVNVSSNIISRFNAADISVGIEAAYCSNLTLIECRIEDNDYYGLWVFRSEVLVEDSYLSGDYIGILSRGTLDCRNCSFSGNVEGIRVEGGTCAVECSTFNDTGGVITAEKGGAGLVIHNSTFNMIRGSAVSHRGKGLKMTGSSITRCFTGVESLSMPGGTVNISGNHFSHCGHGVICTPDGPTSIAYNRFNGTENASISLSEGTSNAVIWGNHVQNVGGTGMAVDSDNWSISGNTIEMCLDAGVRILGAKSGAIEDNGIIDCGEGIHTGICSLKIKGNTIDNCTRAGIVQGEQASLVLDDNSMFGCGLYLEGSSRYRKEPHFPSTNFVNGKPIRYFGEGSFDGEVISGDAGQIIIHGSRDLVLRDLAIENTTCGIQIFYAENLTIHDVGLRNCVTGIRAHRLFMSDIEELSIVGCSGWGMYANDVQFTDIRGCSMVENGCGLFISGSYSHILETDISRNEGEGAVVSRSDPFSVRSSLFMENGGPGLTLEDCNGCSVGGNAFIMNNGSSYEADPDHVQAHDDWTGDGEGNDWDIPSGNFWFDHDADDEDKNGVLDEGYRIPGGLGVDNRSSLFIPSGILPCPVIENVTQIGSEAVVTWQLPEEGLLGPTTSVRVYQDIGPPAGNPVADLVPNVTFYSTGEVGPFNHPYFMLTSVCPYGESAPGPRRSVDIDLDAPTIYIESQIDTFINTSTVTLSYRVVDASDISFIRYAFSGDPDTIDEPPLSNRTINRTFGPFPDGDQWIVIGSADEFGNEGTRTLLFTVDTELPVINIVSPVDGEYMSVEDLRIEWKIDDSSPLRFMNITLDNQTISEDTTARSVVVEDISEGPHRFGIEVSDAAGNSASRSLHLVVDRTIPVIERIVPEVGPLPIEPVVTVSFSEDLDPVRSYIRMTGEAGSSIINGSVMEFAPDGPLSYLTRYEIMVGFYDHAGNGGTHSFSYITVEDPLTAKVIVNCRVLDGKGNELEGVEIYVDGGLAAHTGMNGTAELLLPPGEYELCFVKEGYGRTVLHIVVEPGTPLDLDPVEIEEEARDEPFPWTPLIILSLIVLFALSGTVALIFFRRTEYPPITEE